MNSPSCSLSLWTTCAGEQWDPSLLKLELGEHPTSLYSPHSLLPVAATPPQVCAGEGCSDVCDRVRGRDRDCRGGSGKKVGSRHSSPYRDAGAKKAAAEPREDSETLQMTIQRERARVAELQEVVRALWEELLFIEKTRRDAVLEADDIPASLSSQSTKNFHIPTE